MASLLVIVLATVIAGPNHVEGLGKLALFSEIPTYSKAVYSDVLQAQDYFSYIPLSIQILVLSIYFILDQPCAPSLSIWPKAFVVLVASPI